MRIKKIIEAAMAITLTALLSCELGCARVTTAPAPTTPAAAVPVVKSAPVAKSDSSETLEAIKAYFDRSKAYVQEHSDKNWEEIQAEIKAAVCK